MLRIDIIQHTPVQCDFFQIARMGTSLVLCRALFLLSYFALEGEMYS